MVFALEIEEKGETFGTTMAIATYFFGNEIGLIEIWRKRKSVRFFSVPYTRIFGSLHTCLLLRCSHLVYNQLLLLSSNCYCYCFFVRRVCFFVSGCCKPLALLLHYITFCCHCRSCWVVVIVFVVLCQCWLLFVPVSFWRFVAHFCFFLSVAVYDFR